MAISLEELKRQREQIQKHLDWLDTKIRESSPNGKVEPAQPIAPKAVTTESVAEPVAKETAPLPSSDEESTTKLVPEPDTHTYKAKTQGELQRAKIGCLAFFILSTLLFLFILFGLPYLL